jgi:hypothetical protein
MLFEIIQGSMKIKKIFSVIAVLSIFLLVGCNGERTAAQESSPYPEPTNLETPSLDSTNYLRVATATRQMPTKTIVTPKIPTSNTPTITITPPNPTLTPLPTSSAEKAHEMRLDLMKNNAGCKLPCFWGIMPGETTWVKAQPFLASFAGSIDHGQTVISTEVGVDMTNTTFVISNIIPGFSDPIASSYFVVNGVVNKIAVSPSGTEMRYQLHQVLTEYGIPDEVLLLLSDISPDGKSWFQFFIFYVEEGVTAIYNGPARFDGDVFEACPEGLGPQLILISPGSKDLNMMKRDAFDLPFRVPSINDFPGKDIDFFFETMKTPEACLSFDRPE